jgi:hypothetical protein
MCAGELGCFLTTKGHLLSREGPLVSLKDAAILWALMNHGEIEHREHSPPFVVYVGVATKKADEEDSQIDINP